MPIKIVLRPSIKRVSFLASIHVFVYTTVTVSKNMVQPFNRYNMQAPFGCLFQFQSSRIFLEYQMGAGVAHTGMIDTSHSLNQMNNHDLLGSLKTSQGYFESLVAMTRMLRCGRIFCSISSFLRSQAKNGFHRPGLRLQG